MRSISWYELAVRFKGNESEIIEKKVKDGKYGHRREVQPIIYRLVKQEKEIKKQLKTIYKEIDEIRLHFNKNNDAINTEKCLDILQKIKNNM
jgi:hypothetical protein